MARQVLDNGVILPSEYSDDWYDDMTSNLTKLDEVIGSNAEKLSASDVGAAAISNDYDDLDDKPAYNILRRASVTLTAGGTGNYTDLDSDSKIKAGDYVLDAANKLYSITAIDATNSTYTVSAAALFTVTDKAELGAAALSNDYDDLNNLPGYGILRFCSTAITDNSNIAFANISSVSKIAAGDFLLDTAAKLYRIASIDTVNETAAVTTPLTQLAVDSGVLHKALAEIITGVKTFLDIPLPFKSSTAELGVSGGNTRIILTDKNLLNLAGITFGNYGSSKLSYCRFHIYDKDSNNQEVENFIEFSYVNNNQVAYFRPNKSNFVTLGTVNNRWSKVYADEYYYGSNSVEFSTKFVTTDTAQTILGTKTFTNSIILQNSDTSGVSRDYVCKSQVAVLGDDERGDNTKYRFVDKNNNEICYIRQRKLTNSNTDMSFCVNNIDNDNNSISAEINFIIDRNNDPRISPSVTDSISLGRPTFRWKNIYSNLINGLTPSSLGMPTNNIANIIDISGYLTVLDGSQANTYQAPDNGYIGITMSNCTGIQAYITGFWGNQIIRPTAGALRFFMPICKNMTANILVFGGTIDNARFFPCQGNV